MQASENKSKKQEAKNFGEFAERMVANEYLLKGYTVREHHKYFGKTEIDLIVQKDNVIAIVEVKARATDEDDALLAVTRDKRRRMIRAADSYLKMLPGDFQYRFDIATCVGNMNNFKLEIHEDAFMATDVF